MALQSFMPIILTLLRSGAPVAVGSSLRKGTAAARAAREGALAPKSRSATAPIARRPDKQALREAAAAVVVVQLLECHEREKD